MSKIKIELNEPKTVKFEDLHGGDTFMLHQSSKLVFMKTARGLMDCGFGSEHFFEFNCVLLNDGSYDLRDAGGPVDPVETCLSVVR